MEPVGFDWPHVEGEKIVIGTVFFCPGGWAGGADEERARKKILGVQFVRHRGGEEGGRPHGNPHSKRTWAQEASSYSYSYFFFPLPSFDFSPVVCLPAPSPSLRTAYANPCGPLTHALLLLAGGNSPHHSHKTPPEGGGGTRERRGPRRSIRCELWRTRREALCNSQAALGRSNVLTKRNGINITPTSDPGGSGGWGGRASASNRRTAEVKKNECRMDSGWLCIFAIFKLWRCLR